MPFNCKKALEIRKINKRKYCKVMMCPYQTFVTNFIFGGSNGYPSAMQVQKKHWQIQSIRPTSSHTK